MRILIVSQYFWPEPFRITDCALALRDRGHAVTVLTGMPNYPEGRWYAGYRWYRPMKESWNGMTIVRAPSVSRGQQQSWKLILNYMTFAVSASIVGPLLCRERYDCILVNQLSPVTVGIPGLVMKSIQRVPLLFWIQDLWPESLTATGAVRSSWIVAGVGMLVRWIYRCCDLLLVQSMGFVDAVRAMGADEGKIRYLPNWAESVYAPMKVPNDAPERAKLPKGFIMMFAGNIGAAQDFPSILAAAEQCRDMTDAHIVVLGDGRMRSWVADEIERRQLGSMVHLIGRYPVDAMPRFFACADAMLVTLRDEPIFSLTIPSKVQSYLACGRPIIAALAGEGARVVGEACAGIVCPPENAEALANAIRAMRSQSDTERQRMGSSGRAYCIKYFDREVLCTRLEGWMREAVADTMSRVDGRRSEGVR